jgi:hypothetical protein
VKKRNWTVAVNEEVGVDSIAEFYQLVLHALWHLKLGESASRTAENRTKMPIMSAETKQFSQRIPVQETQDKHNSARL